MLKQHSSFIKQAIATIDCFLILIAFGLAYRIVTPYKTLQPLLNYWVMVVGFMGFYLYFAWTRELFSILNFNWMRNLPGRIIMIFLTATVLGAAILYLLPDSQSSRYLYGMFSALSFVFIGAEKTLMKQIIAYLRRKNHNTTPIIVFGRGRMTAQIVHAIEDHPEWGLRVIRKLDLSLTPADFEGVLKNCYVEEIFFCIPRSLSKADFTIDNYLQVCEEMGRSARVFINITGATSFARWQYHKFMESPTLISHTVELDPDQMIFKRIFDIAGSLAGSCSADRPAVARGRHQTHLTRPGFFQTGAGGKKRQAVHHLQVPFDGHRRRETAKTNCRTLTNAKGRSLKSKTTRA